MWMIEWCLCDTAAATASWASMDLHAFLERISSVDWFRRDSGRAGGKRQPAWCSHNTHDKFAMVFMAKKFLHRCIAAYARVHAHFLRRACMHSDRCSEQHALCERWLLITESPKPPATIGTYVWVLGWIPYIGLAVFSLRFLVFLCILRFRMFNFVFSTLQSRSCLQLTNSCLLRGREGSLLWIDILCFCYRIGIFSKWFAGF